nr:MAG TPA: hypothetical protein [Microviridae sp.]
MYFDSLLSSSFRFCLLLLHRIIDNRGIGNALTKRIFNKIVLISGSLLNRQKIKLPFHIGNNVTHINKVIRQLRRINVNALRLRQHRNITSRKTTENVIHGTLVSIRLNFIIDVAQTFLDKFDIAIIVKTTSKLLLHRLTNVRTHLTRTFIKFGIKLHACHHPLQKTEKQSKPEREPKQA